MHVGHSLLVKSTLHDLGKMTTLEHLAFWPADDTSREAQACGPEAFEHLGQLTALTHLSLNGLVQLNDEGAQPPAAPAQDTIRAPSCAPTSCALKAWQRQASVLFIAHSYSSLHVVLCIFAAMLAMCRCVMAFEHGLSECLIDNLAYFAFQPVPLSAGLAAAWACISQCACSSAGSRCLAGSHACMHDDISNTLGLNFCKNQIICCCAGLKMLTSLSGLQCLDISNTAVSSRGLDCILHLHKLRDLQVAGCLMTAPSALLRILSKQAQLTQLNVLECRLVNIQRHVLSYITCRDMPVLWDCISYVPNLNVLVKGCSKKHSNMLCPL